MDSDTLRFLRDEYSDLLTGNDMPSETEFNQLKEALSGWHAKVQDINKTTEILRLTLTTLLKQREEIEQSIATFDPIFSPIRRVPDDVWGEIFYHCLPSHRNPIPITSEAPLVLTLVCQKWRRVAFSSPWIWTKLHFAFQSSVTDEKYDPQGLFNQQWQLRLNGIRSWLSRSHILPLSISLKCGVVGTIGLKESDHVEREAMQLLIDHASRWQDLEISLPSTSFSTLFNMIDITPTTVPILRSLRVEEDTTLVPSPIYYQLPLAESYSLQKWLSLPTLRSIHTLAYVDLAPCPEYDNRPPSIYCTSLTTLSLYYPTERHVISHILRSCPLLEECYLTVEDDRVLPERDLSMISLPNLKRLWIETDREEEGSLLSELDTPSLLELTLYHVFRDDPHGTSTLSSFLLRCKALDMIAFDPSRISDKLLERIITSVPSVSHLQLDQNPCRRNQPHHHFLEHPNTSEYSIMTGLMTILDKSPNQNINSNHGRILPRLTTFSAHVDVRRSREGDDRHLLMKFLERSIRPISATHSQHDSYPSLESITLVLEGHPQEGSEHAPPIDIKAETIRHAESVGRTVGKDLLLDITYPWKESYEEEIKDRSNRPDLLVSAKAGLEYGTDCTWPYPDY